MSHIVYLVFLCFSSCAFHSTTSLSTMAIDLGCDFLKIGLARPSLPISLASDPLGGKNIPSALYMKYDKIIFGWAALNKITNDPTNVYLHVPCLIGKRLNDYSVQFYLRQFPYYNLKEDPLSKSLYYINYRNETYFVEELLALLLDNFIKLANKGIDKMYPNRYFSDISFNHRTAVITIPSGYKQKERKFLLSICKMVNISVLQLLESNTAGFLTMSSKYTSKESMDGTFGIIDIGFNNIQMTLASIKQIKSTFRGYEFDTSNIKVISSSFLSNVGINNVLSRMREYFTKIIKNEMRNKKKEIFDDPKFISKLYMSCRNLLRRISVSKNANVKVKGLIDGSDFILSLNASVFYNIINDTLKGIENVIKSTLRNTKEYWIIPKGLAVIGGGRYIPYIHHTITNCLKKVPVLKVIDPFFSVVWGATYQASNIARGFFNFPIILPKKTFRSMKIQIEANNILIEQKMTFKLQKSSLIYSELFRNIKYNFNFSTYYQPVAIEGKASTVLKITKPILVHNVYVLNLEDTIRKIKKLEKTEIDKMLSIYTFKGLEIVYSVDIHSTINLESVAALFVKRSKLNITALENAEDLMNTSKRIVINDINLELIHVKLDYRVLQPYHVISEEIMVRRTKRVHVLKEKSKEYFRKEAVRNELQYYVIDLKRKFNEEYYIICTNDIERRRIWSFLDDTSQWMNSHMPQTIEKKEYFQKFDNLINLTYNIDIRVHENRYRPILLKRLKNLLDTTQHFIMNMFVTSGSGESSKGIFTKNETNELRSLNKDIRIWLDEFNEKFKTIKVNNDPPILCKQIIEKIVSLENDHNRLLALIEKRTDPNEKNNNRSDQTLIANADADNVKIKESNDTISEVNSNTDEISASSGKEEKSQCKEQDKSKAISAQRCDEPK